MTSEVVQLVRDILITVSCYTFTSTPIQCFEIIVKKSNIVQYLATLTFNGSFERIPKCDRWHLHFAICSCAQPQGKIGM